MEALSYLCAGRPIVLSAPKENIAAEIIERSNAGIVCPVTDMHAFVGAVEKLLEDPAMRETLGKNARRYAEGVFNIRKIVDKFEAIMQKSLGCSSDRKAAA